MYGGYPKKVKAIRYYAPNDIRLDEIDLPEPKPDEVLLKTEYSTICATDREIWKTGIGVRKDLHYPVILGHEAAQKVVKLGENVTCDADGLPLNVGDTVVTEGVQGCGKCLYCKRGLTHICPQVTWPGATSPGTFVEYWLYPYWIIHKAYEGLSIKQLSQVEPASVGLHGVRRANIQIGDTVLIYGAGPIGLYALQACKWLGAVCIIVSESVEFKRRVAEDLGADITIDPRTEDVVERVLKETGGNGADAVINAVGNTRLHIESLRAARRHGTVVIIGYTLEEHPFNFWSSGVCPKELYVTGSTGHGYWGIREHDFRVVMKLMKAGKIKTDPIITHEFDLEQYKEAFEQSDKPEETIKVGIRFSR